jgi:hypothetical protein
MDGSVNWPDPELLKSFGRKLTFGKETVAQITCGINIGRVIYMAVGVEV